MDVKRAFTFGKDSEWLQTGEPLENASDLLQVLARVRAGGTSACVFRFRNKIKKNKSADENWVVCCKGILNAHLFFSLEQDKLRSGIPQAHNRCMLPS